MSEADSDSHNNFPHAPLTKSTCQNYPPVANCLDIGPELNHNTGAFHGRFSPASFHLDAAANIPLIRQGRRHHS